MTEGGGHYELRLDVNREAELKTPSRCRLAMLCIGVACSDLLGVLISLITLQFRPSKSNPKKHEATYQ